MSEDDFDRLSAMLKAPPPPSPGARDAALRWAWGEAGSPPHGPRSALCQPRSLSSVAICFGS